ncbi:hypothetical protein EDB80DRAFT_2912 [Ilyonectria destructans]|nr:hypothetical protein EDB80DRAFT_2912 [Ilyonectria destructans]
MSRCNGYIFAGPFAVNYSLSACYLIRLGTDVGTLPPARLPFPGDDDGRCFFRSWLNFNIHGAGASDSLWFACDLSLVVVWGAQVSWWFPA